MRQKRKGQKNKKILIIGPSGSGKSYVSATLRKQGVNALDADFVDGLSGWFDADKKQIPYPVDADKEFLDNHEFLWDKNFLQKFLKENDKIYLFGASGNVFDMVDLFDKVYFLKTSPEVLAERLRHESRKNPMGKTDYQLENALNWAKEIEETANKLGVQMIDANQLPEQIFSQISNECASKKVIFFDLYQTLLDVNLDIEKKKRDDKKGWEILVKAINKECNKNIVSEEFVALYKKRRNNFYANGRNEKIHHHNFLEIVSQVLKEDFGLIIPREKVISLIYEYRKISRGYLRLYPGVFETLFQLSKKYTLSTASYTQSCFTQAELQELNIEQFFSYFVYTSDIGFRKESIEFYKHALEIVGKETRDCLMVGDNYDVDVLVPQQLGISAIWLKNPITSGRYAQYIKEHEPENTIDIVIIKKLPDLIATIIS